MAELAGGARRAGARRADACRPVLLLHGFGQSARSWDGVARLLRAEGCAVHAVDWPGFGARRGEHNTAAFSLEALCALLADEVRAVASREGAAPVVVGYSMGGRVAAEALVRGMLAPEGAGASGAGALGSGEAPGAGRLEPEGAADLACRSEGAGTSGDVAHGVGETFAVVSAPISALMLESAGLGPRDAAERAVLAARNAAWAADARARGTRAFMEDWARLPLFASQRALPVAERAALADSRADNDADALALSLEGSGAHRQSDEALTLAALRAASSAGLPVLFLAGALDAKYAALAACAQREAGIRVRVVPGAGHNVHLERPEAFAEAVRELAGS